MGGFVWHLFAMTLLACCLPQLASARACDHSSCINDWVYPNACPVGQTFKTSGSCGGSSCCTTSTCCSTPSSPNCTLTASGSGCCSVYHSMCNSCNMIYTSKRNLNGTYTDICTNSPPFPQPWNCPNNYNKISFQDNKQNSCYQAICVAKNCEITRSFDCTKCQKCFAGNFFISDGSCQPPPSMSGTLATANQVLSQGSNTVMCNAVALNITTDPGVATAVLTIGLDVNPNGAQSDTGNVVTIPYGICSANTVGQVALFTGASAQITGTLPVGATTINCTVVDSNGLRANCFKVVNVVDREFPRITCSDQTVYTGGVNNYAFHNWSHNATATDNVRVVGQMCWGGPANNLFIAGTITNITCAAWDARNQNSTCSYMVTSRDNAAPSITCPANRTLNTTIGRADAQTSFAPSASDNVGVTSIGCDATNSTLFTLTTATVTCTASDAAGNTASCSFFVRVQDKESPVMTCAGPVTVSSVSSGSTGTASFSVSASDNVDVNTFTCNAAISVSGNVAAATAQVSGTFALGPTTVTCVTTDSAGNSKSCNTVVTVLDNTNPEVACADITTTTISNTNYSTLPTGYGETYSDNVAVVSSSCTPSNAGGTRQFQYGRTSVTCQATDAHGNVGQCTFSVFVNDEQLPVVQCPSSSISVATNLTDNITISLPLLNATDNVRVNYTELVVVENGQASLTRTLPGSTRSIVVAQQWPVLLTFKAFDLAGNINSCTFGLSVYSAGAPPDLTPPVIYNCPTPFFYSSPPSPDFFSSMYNSSVYLINVTTVATRRFAPVSWTALNATDNSGFVAQAYLEWSPSLTTASAGLAAGRYVVAYGATDRQGNSRYCAFKVQVVDNERPTFLNCPQANTEYESGAAAGAVPIYWPSPEGVVATDNVGLPNKYGTCTSTPSGYCPSAGVPLTSMLPAGKYAFTYNAVDSWGNTALPCKFNITVVDTDPPVIPDCPLTTVLVQAVVAPGQRVVDISRLCPRIEPVDNIGVSAITYTSIPAGYNCSTPIPISGSEAITIVATAFDAAGHTDDCNIIVTVSDREAPVLSGCSPTSPTLLYADCAPGLPSARVRLPSIAATDNSGSVTLTQASVPVGLTNMSAFTFGASNTITYTAKDASNNPVSCTVRVFISDTQPPVIRGFPVASNTYSITINTDANSDTGTYRFPNLTATDNVEVRTAEYQPTTYSSLNSFAFPVGPNTVTYTASDRSFNSASVTLTIIVRDNQKPVFSGCPSMNQSNPVTLHYNTSDGQPNEQVSWNDITAFDNVDEGRVLTFQDSRPPGFTEGSLYPIGTTTIIYTAVDVAGNSQACTFHIKVSDVEPPVLICPDSVSVTTDSPFISSAVVSWRPPVITDNSNDIEEVFSNYFPGNYSVGRYNVTYSVEDGSGNNASCQFTFQVVLAQAAQPTIEPASSSASTGTIAAGAAGGSIALLVLLVLLILLLMRRNHKRKMQAASSGYAELMSMSDEFVLERARAIQQALVDQRGADPPAAVNAQFIHPTRKFAAPPTTLKELEEYIRNTVKKEIPRDSLEFGAELGAGEFGAVYKGDYNNPDPESGANEKLTVAIKMLKNSTSDEDKVRFLKEAAIMAQFAHPNIVALAGVCTLPNTEPTLIVLEYMHLGALHGYLQSPMVKDQLETLTMLRMALDVGSAMQYLAEAGFVHRDLAARNVLLDENMNCRVGDFGLSVDLATSEEEGGIYSGDEGAKIPVRWASIEAICFRQYSSASDVWSYGVLLWEIWSYAEMPYKGWNNKKVTEQVCEGYRLPKPANCPDEVFRVMIDCWNKNVQRRVTFAKINQALVQAWKDIARETMQGEGAGDGNLYDAGDDDGPNKVAKGDALYDTGDDGTGDAAPPQKAPARKPTEALYDTGDDGTEGPSRQVSSSTSAGARPAGMSVNLLYDVGDDSAGGNEKEFGFQESTQVSESGNGYLSVNNDE